VAVAGYISPEGPVLEGLEGITSEATVGFGRGRQHKTIVSLVTSEPFSLNQIAYLRLPRRSL